MHERLRRLAQAFVDEYYLTETEDNPPRLDIPVVKHLTWTELHSALLAVPFVMLIEWAQNLGKSGAAFTLAMMVAQFVLGEGQRRSKRSKCKHRIGAHDIRQEPWYFGTVSAILWAGIEVVGVIT